MEVETGNITDNPTFLSHFSFGMEKKMSGAMEMFVN